jgi:signal transduction histidine kinase
VSHDANPAIYRDVFRKTDEVAAIVEMPPGRLVDATDRLLSACHLDRASALGRPLTRLFNAGTAARLMEVIRVAVANDREDGANGRSTNPPSTRFLDGRICAVPLTANLAYLKEVDGAPIRGARGRDALLDEMSALSGSLVYIYDVAHQRTCYMNAALADLLGAESGRSISLSRVLPLMHPDDVDDVVRHIDGFPTLVGGQVSRHSFRLLSPYKTWRRVENRYAPLSRDAAGSVRTVIGCAFDVTDRNLPQDRAANADLVFKVEEHERQRIARELHDSTAQHLVAADFMVGEHLRESGEPPDDALSNARATLGQALREIRTLSFLLHAPGLRSAGLTRMLRGFAEGFAARSDLALTVEIAPSMKQFPPAVELMLFRVCQEAFMNVRRHANARSVTLRLYPQGPHVVLEVDDDGEGIRDAAAASFGGVGIESMRARLREVGGVLTIENTGNGTLVRASIPRKIVGKH